VHEKELERATFVGGEKFSEHLNQRIGRATGPR
jgi:hypothetical protein